MHIIFLVYKLLKNRFNPTCYILFLYSLSLTLFFVRFIHLPFVYCKFVVFMYVLFESRPVSPVRNNKVLILSHLILSKAAFKASRHDIIIY